jgi:catechol 2,3-dioxygenase-like lactoylglutathione lyase family enzyme
MLDHVSLRVQDFPRAFSFYRTALAAIGYDVVIEYPDAAGLGEKGKPDFWIMKTDRPVNPTHVAFSCGRERVDAFHAAALAAGGVDNGPAGLRAQYHPHYYSAFVLDPEGNNIEAVCHEPLKPARRIGPARVAPPAVRRKTVTKKAAAKNVLGRKATPRTAAKTKGKKSAPRRR